MRHTQGPWKVGKLKTNVIAKAGGIADCELCGGPIDEAEQRANARLISAAPDYDAAARDILAALSQYGEWDDGCFYYNKHAASELQRPMQALMDAVEKAGTATK